MRQFFIFKGPVDHFRLHLEIVSPPCMAARRHVSSPSPPSSIARKTVAKVWISTTSPLKCMASSTSREFSSLVKSVTRLETRKMPSPSSCTTILACGSQRRGPRTPSLSPSSPLITRAPRTSSLSLSSPLLIRGPRTSSLSPSLPLLTRKPGH